LSQKDFCFHQKDKSFSTTQKELAQKRSIANQFLTVTSRVDEKTKETAGRHSIDGQLFLS
jgi:hypothetical protein